MIKMITKRGDISAINISYRQFAMAFGLWQISTFTYYFNTMIDFTGKKQPTLFITLALSGILASSCGHKKEEVKKTEKSKTLTAQGYVVHPQLFQTDYVSSGSLLPNEEIRIMPEVAGRVTAISFTEGGTVHKGQPLVNIYSEDIRAQIQKLRAQRELQVNIRNRQESLLKIGGISQQEYETTSTQIKSIDADISLAQAQLRRTTVLAPFSGRVSTRNVSVGAVVTPSTEIATLQQTSILKMDFTLPGQYMNEVWKGKKVRFTISGSLDTFTAVVNAIDPSADAVTRAIKARALVQNDKQTLMPGTFTRVIIPLEKNTRALLIPPQSVIPTTREKVVALIKNGKAEMAPVKIGQRTDEAVEILQGLNEGDTILTTGIMQVKPGMAVKVKIPPTP
jgi:membrane fusion protein (multidrug efflux system)